MNLALPREERWSAHTIDAIVRWALIACVFPALAGCRKPLPPAPPRAEGLTLRDPTPSPGFVLREACFPTGPELCFNAVDDNCNGILDEGCGVETGVLQFMIAWDDATDVDLDLIDPSGAKVRLGALGEAETTDRFHKDKSCGGRDETCRGQNIENVYYQGASPPRGRYRVVVRIVAVRSTVFPLHVRFGARVGARSYGGTVELLAPTDTRELAFTL